MNRARRILLAAIGAATPSFITTDGLQARSVGPIAIEPGQSSAANLAADQATLKSAMLQLSPAEKLRVAGDRIRLAKSQSNRPAGPPAGDGRQTASTSNIMGGQTRGSTVYGSPVYGGPKATGGSGMLFAWK